MAGLQTNPTWEKEKALTKQKNIEAYKKHLKNKKKINYTSGKDVKKMQDEYDKKVVALKTKSPKKKDKKKWYSFLKGLEKGGIVPDVEPQTAPGPIGPAGSPQPTFEALPPYGKRMAAGGKNTDTVPAMLTPGEVVLNKKQQKRLGESVGKSPSTIFRSIGVPGFSKGGVMKKYHSFFNTGGKVFKKRKSDTYKGIYLAKMKGK